LSRRKHSYAAQVESGYGAAEILQKIRHTSPCWPRSFNQ